MPLIKISSLSKSFDTKVLDNLSFQIQSGNATGFLGDNGSGKTTTINCILNFIFPDSGEIEIFGQKKLSQKSKKDLGFLPESPCFYGSFTGFEILEFYGKLSQKFSSKDLRVRINELLRKTNLSEARDKKIKFYSKGMLKRIGLAQALIHRPKLIILDEPLSGLDPDGRSILADLLKEVVKEGTGVFLSSHLLHDVERICTHLVILKNGQAGFQGLTKDFIHQFKIGDGSLEEAFTKFKG